MGDVVVTEFVSLDGVMEDPGGAESFRHGGWSFQFDRGQDGDKFKLDELTRADAQLLGRVTYEGFAKAWPNYDDEVGFAEKMNTMPKYVASTTLRDPEWQNSTVISGDVPAAVRGLKDEYTGDILIAGSRTLAQSLMAEDLIDRYHLMVFPVILGAGKRLFPDDATELRRLRLADTKPVGADGVIVLTYEPVRS